ncbi:MAG: CPBP family intramembrane metalloprotease [Pedosphaera sp.]|nr:CPBP family intramembrane metalloprotease [Pedosphaera sp.]
MRPGLALCGYFCFIFLGGALLAPWIHKLIGLANTVSPLFQALANQPFHRFVSRAFIVLGIIGLWPFLRSLAILSWEDVGLKRTGSGLRDFARGLGLGFLSLLIVVLATWVAGARVFNPDISLAQLVKHLTNAALAAAVVAGIEEIFFRGAIFGALRRSYSWKASLLGSSAIYALLHFFERPALPLSIEWHSGLTTLASMSAGLVDLPRLIPGFLTLTMAGCILGLAYQRTGSLMFSIGLHAGWIFWLKSYGFLTREEAGTSAWFWGSSKLIDGWVAFVILCAVLLSLLRWLKPSPECSIRVPST